MSDRPTVILLPGNMCDQRMWSDVLPAFSSWEVIFHLPVEGTIEAMARACLDRIHGQLIPVGFSMGAIVALAIADTAPERIAAMGLIDTNPGADRPDRADARPRQQREAMEIGLARMVREELKPAYFAKENWLNKGLRSKVLDMALGLGPEIFVAQSEALRTRSDYSGVLERLNVPVFVACGAEDDLCPPSLHKKLAASIRNSELHVVPGAGHMLPMEQPQILSNLLSDWLVRVRKELPCQTAS